MILKGDFVSPGRDAAALAMCFLRKCMIDPTHPIDVDSASEIYYLVKEKLYCNLVRILWKDAHKNAKAVPDSLNSFAKESFADFMKSRGNTKFYFYHSTFNTDAALVGVGAPTHVFLQDVADAMGTKCCLSQYSGVTNALGAMLGDVCTYETVPIEIHNIISGGDAENELYRVYGDGVETFDTKEKAISRASEIAKERATEKAMICGAKEIYDVSVQTKDRTADSKICTIYLGTDVTACARGRLL